MLPAIYVPKNMMLEDSNTWQLRFQVQSETSDNLYTISQHKIKKHWGCSCPGWKRYRKCKHLAAVGLPANEIPYEVNIISQ
jgi:hypothetical protein